MGMPSALRNLFAKRHDTATARLYAAAVAAARQPVFYTTHQVPDTLDGRFDMLLLHVTMLMLRLKDEDARQRLFDLMFADIDRSLREMGVGDMSMAKKMKPLLAGFYGRAGAYKSALAADGDASLIAALSRNLYNSHTVAEHAPFMAHYVRAAMALLATQSDGLLAEGQVHFPTVE